MADVTAEKDVAIHELECRLETLTLENKRWTDQNESKGDGTTCVILEATELEALKEQAPKCVDMENPTDHTPPKTLVALRTNAFVLRFVTHQASVLRQPLHGGCAQRQPSCYQVKF